MYETENLIETTRKIINEIELASENIDAYEDCEIIVDLMDEEMFKQISDDDFRKLLQDIRRIHSEVRRTNYDIYIDMARELYRKIPNKNYVIKYHKLEQLSRQISDHDVLKIKDIKLKETIKRLQHVHDNIAARKANIIRRMKFY